MRWFGKRKALEIESERQWRHSRTWEFTFNPDGSVTRQLVESTDRLLPPEPDMTEAD